jgi:AraC-like DNA-binding protein
MNSEAGAKPLDTFPVIRSRDAEEVREAVIRSYGARRFNLLRSTERFDARANHWQSRNIGLSYCSYGAQLQLDFPGGSFFRQQYCLHGGAGIRVDRTPRSVTRDETCVVPPDTPMSVDFGPSFEQLVLRINADALMNKLAALIGAVPGRKLVFEPATRTDGLAMRSLGRMLTFFASELDSVGSMMPPLALAEMEQALIMSFFCSNPNNYSATVEGHARPAASWQVRRAEEYIEAHWDQPITIEALARVTSASVRSIFHHFKQSRGQSPMAFVKQVRLQRARQMLTRTDIHTSVTETAFACGFNNLGNFAKDYFKRYGERPSDTLKSVKGGLRSCD